ncbi:hypothetical protein LTR99_003476 [Exophiala xenobiotica]|uniref:Xylanolytic transcriptional activator regulatory domain-containing protein n=1 Tax=Vermiconidia calcicola TaxID=1690605 RepID=A0AAV9PWU6_9PEZI|nr:hypothetical protein LTR92_003555 [Exophiala xenobiotica]KAK5305931.1 hypothetical protein LTR99_003476 [Exophiala xenobiotica]KAK5529153.1 hypothetical protein LTR25_009890 [Vermiconidia calcicola]KAK5547118.1 hypothetical protein LTR23_002757 [Chaetothyriales sp. CCFEE 6169]
MVKELMQNQTAGHPGNVDTVPTKPTTPPTLPHDPVDMTSPEQLSNARYVGSTHWSAILDDIQELKVVLAGATDVREVTAPTSTPSTTSLTSGDDIIFGGSTNFSLQEIIAQYLPPKVEIDRALAAYFRGETFIVPFVHAFQFQRLYREFWADPTKVNPLWLSMLFSICYMASLVGGATCADLSLQGDLINHRFRLHTAAAKCLIVGRYRRPQPFALEALALYGHCKNLASLDPSREAGTILAIVVRMAYEMGYHRDPDHFGSFTIFEAEMRRRFWAVCKQYDTMVSFQLGLPSSIVMENSDTKPPRHLLDSDFNEYTQDLPPSRSENEPTKLLWFIVKDRMLASFSKVSKDALSFNEKSEAEVYHLDQEIRQVHATTPDILRARALAESLTDSPFLIMTRLYIEFIYLKSVLVLHRKYMVRGNVFSTRACVEAGKSLVRQFVDMYHERAPGGQLYLQRWMLNNFTMNDFLLGVMVLCLVVHLRRRRGEHNFRLETAAEKEILSLLKHSRDICVEKSSASRDAWRVSHAIRLTLDHCAMFSVGSTVPQPDSLNAWSYTSNGVSLRDSEFQLSDPISSVLSPGDEMSDQYGDTGIGTLDSFSFMFNGLDGVDWMTQFDPQISGQDALALNP